MKRTTLILVSVLAVVLIGGGIYFWMNQDKVKNVLQGNQNSAAANTNTGLENVNSASGNLNLPNEQKGDQSMDATGTVAGTSLHFSSASRVDSFEGDGAGDDQMFVVVYFDGVASDKVLPVKRAIESGEIKLMTNQGEGQIATIKVATTAFQNDRGYVKFSVGSGSGNFRLQVGTGTAVQEFELPL